MADLNRIGGAGAALDDNVDSQVDDLFAYHPADDHQAAAMREVRIALADAFKAVLRFCPPCPDRTVALRKIREARMDANSAISLRGQY